MSLLFKLLLALSLAHVALSWGDEKPVEEDFCDAEWDGKVEYKAEGEQDGATPEEEAPVDDGATTEQTEEGSTEGGEETKADDGDTTEEAGEGSTEGGEEPTGKDKTPEEKPSKASKEDERGDPRNTYQKSTELVRAAANVDDIQDGYLKGSLNNRLQEHIRNPIIGAAGKLPNFKKVQIEPCFKTLQQDLKKEIEASKKEFADCKKKTESSYECMVKMEPGFAAHVKTIGEKIVQCMNKSK
ncbi:30 kDa salivary gland allergen Aed a 3-like isoform X1 [Culex pipiens pallens]|uniref:30 kDa salivary gland allergen Aed a 3-like isoform X1 n=1 Tax=Culex pipiens pallens TaxID=42434 RepID=UPI001954A069|nr:30 kDa salivary gland allergen Aed a 3-like isoform X1 [Culex pipiens pallens]